MLDSKFCEINDYIFEAPNNARKTKFNKLFSRIKGGNILDIGCGYAGLYWALSYFERVNNIYFYDYYKENIDRLNSLINKLTPNFLEENFSETIKYLKQQEQIKINKTCSEIAEKLLSKIKVIKQQSFFDELPNGFFDIIISSEAIECVDNKTDFKKVLLNIYKSLKNNGQLIGNILNYKEISSITEDLITNKMEGKLNPSENELRISLSESNYKNIEIEVVEFPKLNNRSKYIYYSGIKNEK